MLLSRGSEIGFRLLRTAAGLLCLIAIPVLAEQPDSKETLSAEILSDSGSQSTGQGGPPATVCEPATFGSPFVTLDSWIYPAIFRLYGLGFLNHVF